MLLATMKDVGVFRHSIFFGIIEIDGIKWAFEKFTDKKQFCAIGSVKANIGHLFEGAGIAGLIKAVLSLKHKQIVPLAHFKSPNSKINFERSPVYVNTKLSQWVTDGFPRRCGISAFGLSGTNCHVVLEEAPEIKKEENGVEKGLNVLTLSAKSKEALKQLVKNYRDMEYSKLNLADICYTANIGRGHYGYRLAIVLEDKSDLKAKLEKISLADFQSDFVDGIYYEHHKVITGKAAGTKDNGIKEGKKREISTSANTKIGEFLDSRRQSRKILDEICMLYVEGAEVQWDELYKNENRSKVSLPAYPFEAKRCWISMPRTKINKFEGLNFSGLLDRSDLPDELSLDLKKVLEKWKEQLENMTEDAFSAKDQFRTKLLGRENGEYTNTERVVAEAWGEALGLEELNEYDNFFELGGDSIIAVKIGNLIMERINVKIEVAEILRFQTFKEFSECVESKCLKLVGASAYSAIEPIEEREYYQVSSAQKRMYIVSQIKGAGTSYNLPGALVFEGNLNKQKFEWVFRTLVKRHEIFRTYFKFVDSEIVQYINKESDFSVTYEEASEDRITEISEEFVKPFDLGKAPMLRVKLIKIAEDKHLALFDMHHIISDWTSLGILVDEFIRLYTGIKLPDLSIQYKDFAQWQNKLFESLEMKKQEEYWLNKFAKKAPLLSLPTDYERPLLRSSEGTRLKFVVCEELADKLYNLSKETGSTLYMVLLAAYNLLISKYTGQQDIVVGTPIAGRNHLDVENMMGVFINMLAMRNYPEGHKAFAEFLKEVKKNALEAYENQDYQFEELVKKLGLEKDVSRNPVFETMFALQNIEIPDIEIDGILIKNYELECKVSQYDLAFEAVEKSGELIFSVDYCTKLFKQETIQRIINDYIKILDIVVNDKNIRISQIELTNKYSELDNVMCEEIEFDF